MDSLLRKIKNILQKIKGAFPTAMPTGVTEFNAWSDSIIKIYNLPMDERSVKFGLCALIMRLNPTEAYKAKRFFALCLHKGAAAQVAAYVMEDIKNQQKAEYEAQLAASSKPEVTPNAETSNVSVPV